MRTKFADLNHKTSPEQRAAVQKRVDATLEKMKLHELRKAAKGRIRAEADQAHHEPAPTDPAKP